MSLYSNHLILIMVEVIKYLEREGKRALSFGDSGFMQDEHAKWYAGDGRFGILPNMRDYLSDQLFRGILFNGDGIDMTLASEVISARGISLGEGISNTSMGEWLLSRKLRGLVELVESVRGGKPLHLFPTRSDEGEVLTFSRDKPRVDTYGKVGRFKLTLLGRTASVPNEVA